MVAAASSDGACTVVMKMDGCGERRGEARGGGGGGERKGRRGKLRNEHFGRGESVVVGQRATEIRRH